MAVIEAIDEGEQHKGQNGGDQHPETERAIQQQEERGSTTTLLTGEPGGSRWS
jgi:hypothetical protein